MKWICADFAFLDGTWRKSIYLQLTDTGQIAQISDSRPDDDVQKYGGSVVPGFINAHCHLELSHMAGLVPTGSGLPDFLSGVLRLRDFEESEIRAFAQMSDKDMYRSGIQAVGDICNTLHTSEAKLNSSIQYANFVEAYDLWNGTDDNPMLAGHETTYDQIEMKDDDYRSLVPHAPYSVSPAGFEWIASKEDSSASGAISMHNQETPTENQFFTSRSGQLYQFFAGMGLPLQDSPMAPSALAYALPYLPRERNALLVHNTMSQEEDFQLAHDHSSRIYWVTCPNANLYIENRLPDYHLWRNQRAKIAVGTDSITSNWQLSILEELKTISKYVSSIPSEELITWATVNGAQALGFDDLGDLRIGTQPGIILLDYDPSQPLHTIAKAPERLF